MADTKKPGSAAPAKRPRLKLLQLKSADCWVYDHSQGSITVYGDRGKPLDVGHVNFLLDMAKRKLLE